MRLMKRIRSYRQTSVSKSESLDESWKSPSCKSTVTKSKCIEDNGGSNSSMQFIVTSHPKEYSRDSIRTFNWVTNQMDDFEISDDSTADETSLDDSDSPTKKPSNHGSSDGTGGWAWISLCWGSNAVKVTDDARSYQSSNEDDDDDASNGSSQPSLSRVDQVLALRAMADDDISDITSVASIDDSDSDSSEGS